MTEDELILSLCNEKALVPEGTDEDMIREFRNRYEDHAALITKAAQGDEKALRRLRWICGLRVVT